MLKKSTFLLLTIFLLLFLGGCDSDTKQSTDNKKLSSTKVDKETYALPNQMTWSVYDVGSGGYSEMSAIANMLTGVSGTKIRMLPSATGIGRMIPLRDGTASIGKVGDEIQFAFEAMEEFVDPSWGPQNVRAVWAPTSSTGFAVRKDANIKKISDLKGKKVPWIVGNSSINIKTEATLAFAGLTLDDVKLIELTSYAGQSDALVLGKIDVASINPTASAMYEADSKVGIQWLDMDQNDTEGWKRVQEVASWFFPKSQSGIPGLEGEITLQGHGYLIASYEDQDSETIYELLRAMDENFDQYKDAALNLVEYDTDKVLNEPRGIPFHEGTIKFLEEKGLWDDKKQAKNDQLVERHLKLKEAWDKVVDESVEKGISNKDFPEYWLERKKELVQ
ncbi:TAXI family TRAP transporter solute-binding subunit [Psychrobacillus sp. NPDC096426]|uniref:TAXI family TRAP transporter solute-binding subunit n=1 Tax=Psychrobacillus sp. NPDC096426 TaxID=3364491 RepID=UPI0037F3F2B6